jgi:hypothetical protein
MKMYLSKVHNMHPSFQRFCIMKIPREDNEKTDHLAQMASVENMEAEEGRDPIWNLTHPSISNQALELATIEEVTDWRRELINYLQN